MSKYLIIIVSCLSLSCSGRVGDGFRYKRAVASKCKECNSSSNAFYISFANNINIIPEPEKGVSQIVPIDKYTLLVPISKAYKEKQVLKKSIRSIKKVNR
jgi:hypothetical protein